MSPMRVVVTIVTSGVVCLGAVVSEAQTQRPSAGPITAVGCISPAVHDGSLSGSPGVPPATPATAPVLANSAQPTGAFLLNSATAPDATAEQRTHAAAGHVPKENAVTYELEGEQAELERRVGELVEVSGTLTVNAKGTGSTKSTVNHLKLSSVRALAPKCPSAAELDK
jgi:hypothetical protein